MIRKINGLRWAAPCDRPPMIPFPRPRLQSKKAGLRYERKVAAQFPSSLHGQWFEFEDKRGHGFCQPDLIISYLPAFFLIAEVKYSLCEDAFEKLNRLYIPIARAALRSPCCGIVVVKNLIPGAYSRHRVCSNLDDAIEAVRSGITPVLHWIGQPLILRATPTFKSFNRPQTSAPTYLGM